MIGGVKEASMTRYATWVTGFLLSTIIAANPAKADMGHNGGSHGSMHGGFHGSMHGGFHGHMDGRFHNHFFFHDRFHNHFHNHFFFAHNHFFFRPFFFFGSPVFAPVPVALFPPTPFPAFITAPAVAAPGMAAPTATAGNCYEFQTSIMMDDGQVQPAWGNACMQADGSWQIVG
jgi:hypothetical protein